MRERESRKIKLRAWALQPLHRLQVESVFGRERKEKGSGQPEGIMACGLTAACKKCEYPAKR